MPRQTTGTKQERDELRRSMLADGLSYEQIANEMRGLWGFRPRAAWRHAYGWTQRDVADRFNQAAHDPNASMTGNRISDYETWPDGGNKPTLRALNVLARVYSTHISCLVDFIDRAAATGADRIAFDLGSTNSMVVAAPRAKESVEVYDRRPVSSNNQEQLSSSLSKDLEQNIPVSNSNPFLVDPADELSPRQLQDLVNAVAYQSKSHAESAQEHGMPDILLDDLTAEVKHLTREHLVADTPHLFAETVQARNKVYRLLERRQYPGQTSHLYYLASVLCALLADTSMSFGMPQASLEQTRAVSAYAEIIGHNSLRLWARMTQAVLAHTAGRPQRALKLAQSAEEWATGPLGRAFFHGGVARYSAATGHAEGARSSLSLAFDAHESATGESQLFEVLGGMFSYPAARLFCVSTRVGLDLHDGEQAESQAMQALTAYEAGPVEERPYGNILAARIDLAHARLLQGQIDGMTDALDIALRVPPEQRLDWVVQRLKDFYRTLQGHSVALSPTGRQLAEEIEEFCGVTAADQYPNIGR